MNRQAGFRATLDMHETPHIERGGQQSAGEFCHRYRVAAEQQQKPVLAISADRRLAPPSTLRSPDDVTVMADDSQVLNGEGVVSQGIASVRMTIQVHPA